MMPECYAHLALNGLLCLLLIVIIMVLFRVFLLLGIAIRIAQRVDYVSNWHNWGGILKSFLPWSRKK